jgi:hypothetical protein
MCEKHPSIGKMRPEMDCGFVRLVEHIRDFFRANPGAVLRPRDLKMLVGGKEPDIHAACEYLKGEGLLAEKLYARQHVYKLRREQLLPPRPESLE